MLYNILIDITSKADHVFLFFNPMETKKIFCFLLKITSIFENLIRFLLLSNGVDIIHLNSSFHVSKLFLNIFFSLKSVLEQCYN